MGVSFIIVAGPRQQSHSKVRVPRGSWRHFTISDSRLLQPGGPGPRIYIPQEQGGSFIPPGTGFPFRRLQRLTVLRWRYCSLPPHGIEELIAYFPCATYLVVDTTLAAQKLPRLRVSLLLYVYSLPRERIYRTVVQERQGSTQTAGWYRKPSFILQNKESGLKIPRKIYLPMPFKPPVRSGHAAIVCNFKSDLPVVFNKGFSTNSNSPHTSQLCNLPHVSPASQHCVFKWLTLLTSANRRILCVA
jgi:hypothetical protein